MNPFYPNHPRELNQSVVTWLTLILAMIVVMVAIGGITRLTESGLSITEWKPVTGAVPPTSGAEWQAEFAKYQASPEYQLRRQDMTLTQFKRIYFWEWLHRNWGRVIGLAYFIPCLYFLLRRKVTGRVAALLLGGVFLIALQGLAGWLMVKSGLSNRPFVSHYRLAIHLQLALLLFSYLLWIRQSLWMEITPVAYEPGARGLKRHLWFALVLLAVQITWGAFTAGLDAGKAYNTYPFMADRFTPPGMLTTPTGEGTRWMNLLDLPAAVQWFHRWMALVVFVQLLWVWFAAQRIYLTERQRNALNAMLIAVCLQFILGIAALVNAVPIGLGVAHQVNVLFLIGSMVVALQSLHTTTRNH